MPDPTPSLVAGLAAVAVSLLSVWGASQFARGSLLNRNADLAGLVLGLITATVLSPIRPTLAASSALDRLLLFGLPGALLVDGLPWEPRIRCLLRWATAIAVPIVLLHGSGYLQPGGWPSQVRAGVIGLSGVLLALAWNRGNDHVKLSSDRTLDAAVVLALLTAGALILMGGYIKGGAAAFLIAAVLATTALTGGGIVKRPVDPSVSGIAVVGLFGVAFVGCYFGRLNALQALVVFLAPLLAVRQTGPDSQLRPGALLLVAFPLIVMLVLAKHEFDRQFAPFL